VKMRFPVAVGLILGTTLGLGLGLLGDEIRPTAGTFLEAPVYGLATLFGRVFVPGEWGGLYFLAPLWFLYWAGLGAVAGYLIWRLFLAKRKARVIAEPNAGDNRREP
jgi:hypothetical protein